MFNDELMPSESVSDGICFRISILDYEKRSDMFVLKLYVLHGVYVQRSSLAIWKRQVKTGGV